MWTRSDMLGRAALLLTVLSAAASRPATSQDLRIAVGSQVTRVAASTSRSYPAFPLTVLAHLGGEVAGNGGYLIVHLFGDTLRFREGQSYFQLNGAPVPLHRWTFAQHGVLYLPQTFYTDWLTGRYAKRLRFAGGTLFLEAGPSGPRPDTAVSLVTQPQAATVPPSDRVARSAPRPGDSTRAVASAKPKSRRRAKARRDPDDLLPGTLQGFIDSRVSGVYDSNIDHGVAPQGSYGTIGRLAVGLQNSRSDPLLTAQYNLGFYRFANTERWNRTTHDLSAEIAPRLGPVRAGLAGAVRVGSVTEDRELVNQLSLGPWLEASLTPAIRVTGYGELRTRRVTGAVERSDTAWLAGLKLVRRWRYGGRWEVQGEHEANRSERSSSRYRGWAGRAMVRLPLGRSDRIGLELTHRQRHYAESLVELEDEEVARRDRRWTPALTYTHEFGDGYWTVELDYEIDSNRSNDTEKAYVAHRTGFTIRRRW